MNFAFKLRIVHLKRVILQCRALDGQFYPVGSNHALDPTML